MASSGMPTDDGSRSIETIWRMESARIVAGLVRIVRDLDTAEDLAQDALVAALEEWPRNGIPPNPGAWLMLTAKRRGIDMMRRRALVERKHDQIVSEGDAAGIVPAPE